MYRALALSSFLCLVLSLASCRERSHPTDQDMIELFAQKEDEFRSIQYIIQSGIPGDHYPAFEYDADSLRLEGIPMRTKHLLDSLLARLGVTRIFYTGVDTDSLLRRNPSYAKWIVLHYHSVGLGVSGSSKNFLYAPLLKEYINEYDRSILSNPAIGGISLQKIVYDDTDNHIPTGIPNVALYRPLNNDWYIALEID